MSSIIEIKNLSKRYKNTTAVKNISFSVNKGEVFGFLGPNGAGKTTTINILLGLLHQDKGKCMIFQRNISEIDKSIYKKMGVVFEEKNLYNRLTGTQNLKFFGDMYGVGIDRINYLLNKFDLSEAASRQVKTYSKGMRQRLLICRALLNEPELLILDEPTGGLDPVSLRIIHNSILDLKKEGKTILLSTHYMEEAERLCDRLAFINKGQIITINTPDQLKKKYGQDILELRINCIKVDKSIGEIEKILEAYDSLVFEDNYTSVLLSMKYNNLGEKLDKVKQLTDIISIHSREASLHDVFIRITGNN